MASSVRLIRSAAWTPCERETGIPARKKKESVPIKLTLRVGEGPKQYGTPRMYQAIAPTSAAQILSCRISRTSSETFRLMGGLISGAEPSQILSIMLNALVFSEVARAIISEIDYVTVSVKWWLRVDGKSAHETGVNKPSIPSHQRHAWARSQPL